MSIFRRIFPASSKNAGHSKMTTFGKIIKLPMFMTLREPFQYEELKTSAEQAAQADADSDSIDKYIFHGDGVAVQGGYKTPFELSLAPAMQAQSSRIRDIGRRDVLAAEAVQLELDEESASQSAKLEHLQQKIAATSEAISQEVSILEGSKLGHGEVYRPGTKPNHNGFNGLWSANRHIIIYLLVGIVDAGVLWKSLEFLFDGNGVEAIIFSLPAIGVQIIFPHFIGEKLNLLLHGTKKVVREILFLAALGVAWAGFVYSISYIRIMHLGEQLAAAQANDPALGTKIQLLQIFTPIILIGLGFWLILEVIKHNQHEVNFVKLSRLNSKLSKKKLDAESTLARLKLRSQQQAKAVASLKSSVTDHVEVVEKLFPDAARQLYRRQLVNSKGDPEFTTQATK